MAYGCDKLGKEAREALLHGQLQEGLKMELMKSPSVSGAQSYSNLCLAAKNEERRLAELSKRYHYKSNSETAQGFGTHAGQRKPSSRPPPTANENNKKPTSSQTSQAQKKCYTCGSTKHFQKDCKGHSTESKGQTLKLSQARQVTTVSPRDNPLSYLCSDSDGDEEVKRVTVEDKGSRPRYAEVSVQCVLLSG